jgi:hypothetical protein
MTVNENDLIHSLRCLVEQVETYEKDNKVRFQMAWTATLLVGQFKEQNEIIKNLIKRLNAVKKSILPNLEFAE